MNRGDVVIAAGPGFGTKPRPYVIVQADEYLALTTLILLPITTELASPPSLLRVRLEPGAGTGLRKSSEVMADIPVTVRIGKVGQRIGRLSAADMARVERALLLVLGFAG